MTTYAEFIRSKRANIKSFGFQCGDTPQRLFGWQEHVVRWAVERGRAALFCDCGMGKTAMQLAWAEAVVKHTGGTVMLHCPIGVRQQTIREAQKFDISVPVVAVDDQSEVVAGTIVVANYEKLHRFDPTQFVGVVLDESSILKSFTGSTKRRLIDSYSDTPYRLACTATPAPNDQMELGNHAEFLGVMRSSEMLSRWFINDTMKAGGYRLKGHAAESFWQWMASWAVCMRKPSDLDERFSDDGYELPPLIRTDHEIVMESGPCVESSTLFGVTSLNATTVHSAKRASCKARSQQVADLIASDDSEGPWIVWCDTNYEADDLVKAIRPICESLTEVRGSDKESQKEMALAKFSSGGSRVIVTKPDIAGFGMNWQHCNNVCFVGLSYSYEKFYQAVRRSWRFGQARPVNVHVITTDVEAVIDATVDRKADSHAKMQDSMAAAMREFQCAVHAEDLRRDEYVPSQRMQIPDWVGT